MSSLVGEYVGFIEEDPNTTNKVGLVLDKVFWGHTLSPASPCQWYMIMTNDGVIRNVAPINVTRKTNHEEYKQR